jgi:hypothetical protein
MKKTIILGVIFLSGCAGRMSPEASAALMQWGQNMQQMGQPRALVSPPTQTQCWRSGIFVNCNQY